MEQKIPRTTNSEFCRRCGTCCRKGGPGLHIEDQQLVDSGKIPLKHLLTLRQGEPVYDNVTGYTAPSVTDVIKIKDRRDNASGCVYYDFNNGCSMYDDRPVECKALKCWDTREIERIYSCRRLTRRHLLSKVHGLWELVADHQDYCDYAYIAELAAKISQNRQVEEARKELLELIRYDRHLRTITLKRGNLDPEILLFLFGRPLSFTIRLFNLTLHGQIIEVFGSKSQVCYRRNGS